jgi:hypothetical protein
MQTPSPIIAKIQKLLNLAGNNPSAEESAAAFGAAQALATKHAIDIAELALAGDAPAEDTEILIDLIACGKRVDSWRSILLRAVAECFGVYPVILTGPDGAKSFKICGVRANLETTKYMYAAICAEIERLAKRNAMGAGKSYATAYRQGAAATVGTRLRDQHSAAKQAAHRAGANPAAIAVVESAHAAAKAWLTAQGIHMRKVRTTVRDGAAYAAGQRDGARVNLGGASTAIGRGNLALKA